MSAESPELPVAPIRFVRERPLDLSSEDLEKPSLERNLDGLMWLDVVGLPESRRLSVLEPSLPQRLKEPVWIRMSAVDDARLEDNFPAKHTIDDVGKRCPTIALKMSIHIYTKVPWEALSWFIGDAPRRPAESTGEHGFPTHF